MNQTAAPLNFPGEHGDHLLNGGHPSGRGATSRCRRAGPCRRRRRRRQGHFTLHGDGASIPVRSFSRRRHRPDDRRRACNHGRRRRSVLRISLSNRWRGFHITAATGFRSRRCYCGQARLRAEAEPTEVEDAFKCRATLMDRTIICATACTGAEITPFYRVPYEDWMIWAYGGHRPPAL